MPDNILDLFIERATKIKELEDELNRLKHDQHEAGEQIKDLILEADDGNIKRPGGTIYLQRELVVRPRNNYAATCFMLKKLGHEKYVAERIVNEKEFARRLADDDALLKSLEGVVDAFPLFHVRVRRRNT
jgi:hypothetical protein